MSSTAAELHGLVRASAETLGVLSLVRGLEMSFLGRVMGDASAALAIVQIEGPGAFCHVDRHYLGAGEGGVGGDPGSSSHAWRRDAGGDRGHGGCPARRCETCGSAGGARTTQLGFSERLGQCSVDQDRCEVDDHPHDGARTTGLEWGGGENHSYGRQRAEDICRALERARLAFGAVGVQTALVNGADGGSAAEWRSNQAEGECEHTCVPVPQDTADVMHG